MKLCRRIEHDGRKAWLEKQNTMIKNRPPEPSLLGSSLFSNVSIKSLSDSSPRNIASNPSPIRTQFEQATLSEEDRKILRLMALRREAAIKNEEMARSIRGIWAEEKRTCIRNAEERAKAWNEYVAQKRRAENLEHFWRRQNQIDAIKEEKILLESRINEKHERFERRRLEICAQKRMKPEATLCLRRQRDWEKDAENSLKAKRCEDKARRAEEKQKIIWTEKMRRIRESSLRRDIKWQAAKDLREEMKRKADEIQKENLKREKCCGLLREHRVLDAVEWKKRMALEKNQMKQQYHAFIYSKLKEEEREKEAQARMQLQEKDARMKAIRDRKELAILRSRSNSRMAATLRQKIKSSYDC